MHPTEPPDPLTVGVNHSDLYQFFLCDKSIVVLSDKRRNKADLCQLCQKYKSLLCLQKGNNTHTTHTTPWAQSYTLSHAHADTHKKDHFI